MLHSAANTTYQSQHNGVTFGALRAASGPGYQVGLSDRLITYAGSPSHQVRTYRR